MTDQQAELEDLPEDVGIEQREDGNFYAFTRYGKFEFTEKVPLYRLKSLHKPKHERYLAEVAARLRFFMNKKIEDYRLGKA